MWIVIDEDRRSGTNALPFSSREAAEVAARDYAGPGAEPAELTEAAREDGWVLLLEYGAEGECVRVVRRELDRWP